MYKISHSLSRPFAVSAGQDGSNLTATKTAEKPPAAAMASQKPSATGITNYPHSYAFGAKRRIFDKGPDVSSNTIDFILRKRGFL